MATLLGTSERVRILRQESGLSQIEFSEALEISQRKISRLENGQSLDRKTAERMSRKFGVSLEWLVYGRGDAPAGLAQSDNRESDIINFPILDPDNEEIPDNDLETFPFSRKLFQMYFPRINMEDLKMWWVMGESMAPLVYPGDIVMIIANGKYRGDGIYLIKLFGAYGIRRIHRRSETDFSLICENEKYDVQEVTSKSDFQIVGNVIWTSKKISN